MAWSVEGHPLLWEAKADVWPETAPLLFPVVGWTRNGEVRVDGQTYPLALHGFARHRAFRLAAQQAERVQFELISDAATRALYPFDFRFGVDYAVEDGSLSTTVTVTNTGDRPMPYACGLHPGFRWPFAGAKRRITGWFLPSPKISRAEDRARRPDRPRDTAAASAGESVAARRGSFLNDALCFLDAKSRRVRFEAPDGAALVVESEDFPHFGIWCRPGNGYLSQSSNGRGSAIQRILPAIFLPSRRCAFSSPGASARHGAHYRYKAAP